MAARAACGERERSRFAVVFGSVLTGVGSVLAALSDDDVLVLDVEGFFDEVPSSVALESVDLDESDGRPSLSDLDVLDFFVGIAASDPLLLEELFSEDEAGSGFLAGLSSEELLYDQELSDDDDDDDSELSADELTLVAAVGLIGFVADVGSTLGMAFIMGIPFNFFAGGTSSSDEDELESESELDCSLVVAFRLSLLAAPLTVDFGKGILAPEASFSSSASLSELEVEEDPEMATALADFVSALDAGFVCFLFLASLSELELDEVSEVLGLPATLLLRFGTGARASSEVSRPDSLSSLLVSLLPLLDVCSAEPLVMLFALRFFLLFVGFRESLSPSSSLLLLVSCCSVCSYPLYQSLKILSKLGIPFGSLTPSSWSHASNFFRATHCDV